MDEVERNLTGKFNLSPEKASRRLNHMRSAFPNAVVKDYEDLIPAMTNDPKDRHVAAAAVRGGAALIVTANIRDFPPESLEQYDIEAVHPPNGADADHADKLLTLVEFVHRGLLRRGTT